ncbi:MAG: hypothetical protein KAX05_08065 [Bacteroidales bacterium]|nr:hypothetical protein [Bacteroidales bacterium]
MKKLILTAALILVVGTTFGQTLQKGNLIGTHVTTVDLKPDVTMEQFQEFVISKVIPEMEKHYPGWKAYSVKGIRGENENSIGMIYVIKSEEHRDKYYNEDGSLNELGKATQEKLNPVLEELEKLGTYTTTFTDWLIL